MNSFAGKVKPSGLSIARSKTAYETSEEYRDKIAAGQSPYPAKAPWYPFVAGQLTELLTSALEGYPYPLKAWISNMEQPVLRCSWSTRRRGRKAKRPSPTAALHRD
ncbi:tetrathionate reductase subunit A [Salmonella enterica subsp. houtenae]|nr:tetrathionate reductase subunit A [Salmonella enterica subsp. houtenae]